MGCVALHIHGVTLVLRGRLQQAVIAVASPRVAVVPSFAQTIFVLPALACETTNMEYHRATVEDNDERDG